LPEFEGGRVGIHVMTGVDPGYPQRGPYEGSEGTSPGRTQGKTGGGRAAGSRLTTPVRPL
ncbi:MAG TPA: hypothetical protein VMV04_20905, partial [Thermodesulfobacteriota bacterium]|nr:hypothetical protein [Thermodesulfobacteriota bacterium]